LRISSVDGTAFIDGANASVTALADGNHQIEIYDASNRMLRGVLKAAGTSEGLGDALNVSNCVNIGGFTTFDGVSATGFHAVKEVESIGRCGVPDEINLTENALYKVAFTGALSSGTVPYSSLRTNFTATSMGETTNLVVGDNTYYRTWASATTVGVLEFSMIAGSATDFTVSSLAVKQVTAPSSSGATIVSAKGGETYNWAYKNSSFVFNASSYYCIIKTIR
jgi:hypothetical protein